MYFLIEPKSSISVHCSLRVVPPMGTLSSCRLFYRTRHHPDKSTQSSKNIKSGTISIQRSMTCHPRSVDQSNSTTRYCFHAKAGRSLTTFMFSEFCVFVITLFLLLSFLTFQRQNIFFGLIDNKFRFPPPRQTNGG